MVKIANGPTSQEDTQMNTCRKIKSLGLAGALLVGTTVHGATRYWVVGDGNWDFTTTNWHTSAGGGTNGYLHGW